MIRNIILTIFIALFSTSPAFAEDSPLMIIRFNQDYINYERQLEKAVVSATNAKPTVFFDIVSIVPETSDSKENKTLSKAAEYRADQVIENIAGVGIAQDKIRLTYQNSKIAKNNEVHIFVR